MAAEHSSSSSDTSDWSSVDSEEEMDDLLSELKEEGEERDIDENYVELDQFADSFEISRDVYDYDAHIQLINAAKGLIDSPHNNFDGHRLKCLARKRMSKYFPLTPELWLEWIQDEIGLMHHDKSKINKLYQKAVQDYTSPELWEKYCCFCLETINTNYSISDLRRVFEQALTAVGLHVTKGDIIWKLYRDFENSVRGNAQNECEEDQQTARLERLFKRQLSVPLMNIMDTWRECESMLKKPPTQISKEILAQLDSYKPYEQELLKTTPPSYEAYRAYLDYEKASGSNPARVQCLYERALLDHCLQEQLWLDYTEYVETKLKIKDIILSVYARSVRNCPWSGQLWCNYLIAKERFRESHNVIKGNYEEILSSGVLPSAPVYLAIWQTYIDYMRRRIPELDSRTLISDEKLEWRRTVLRAVQFITSAYPDGDPTCSLVRYWARMEAIYCGNIQESRRLWSDIIVKGHANNAQMWMEYCRLERSQGDPEHCRKVFQQAAASVSDYPEWIFEEWIMYEREEGTLETLGRAEAKIAKQKKRVDDMRAKAAREEHQTLQKQQTKHLRKKDKGAQNDSYSSNNNQRATKRKYPDEKPEKRVSPVIDVEKTKNGAECVFKIPQSPSTSSKSSSPMCSQQDCDLESPAAKKSKPEDETTQEGKAQTRYRYPAKEKFLHDSSKDHRTVFVKNLSYNITESEIKAAFSKCGSIVDIRIAENNKHQFKGFCYVEFEDQSSAEKALEMDNCKLKDRPMYVDWSEDRTKTTTKRQFKYDTKLEKNKLFVSGLPRSATCEKLLEIFKKYGTVMDVRIVTYRSGISKGLAFVEFEKESDASRAVFGEDNTVIDEHTINVAISNPPKRNPKKELLTKPSENKTCHTELTTENKKAAHIKLKKESLHPELTTNEKFPHDKMQDETSIPKPTQDEAQSTRSTQDSDQSRTKETTKSYPKSLGAKGVDGPRGKGRTQLSFVPRALNRKASKKE